MLLPLLMPSLLLVLPFPGPPQGRCCCGRLIVAEVLLLQGSLLPACSRLLATEQIQLPRNSRQLRFTARPEPVRMPPPHCLPACRWRPQGGARLGSALLSGCWQAAICMWNDLSIGYTRRVRATPPAATR